MATTWVVRTAANGGSDGNGGTSAAIRSQGTDGVTNGTNTLTSASAAWSAADVGHGIQISGNWRLITAVGSATSLTFSGATIATATGRTWIVGGPLATIGKALASGSIVAAGDTVAVGPGVYRQASHVTCAVSGSSGNPITLLGDCDGTYTGDVGEVRWTTHSTDDGNANAADYLLNLAGQSYLTIQKILFQGGWSNLTARIDCISGNGNNASSTFSGTNIIIQDCVFNSVWGGSAIGINVSFGTTINWQVDRCTFFTPHGTASIGIWPQLGSGSDYSIGLTVSNCLVVGAPINISNQGAGANKGGGVTVEHCTFLADNQAVIATTNNSTSSPSFVQNCFIIAATALTGGTTGTIVENNNVLLATAPRSNVATGNNTWAGAQQNILAPTLSLGQESIFGLPIRPFLTPYGGCHALGFGVNGSYTTAYDLLNRPRPSGSGTTNGNTDSGTATAGASTSLTDSGKTWTTNAYAGQLVKLTGGTGSGQIRWITSNTGTVLTITPAWATNPDNTSTFSIENPGAESDIGALSWHDSDATDTSTYDSSPASRRLVGYRSARRYIPVDSGVSCTIAVKLRYDSNYGTANSRPQVALLAAPALGVTLQTITATTSALNAWETETFSAITPTASGVICVEIRSLDSNGYGSCWWDTWSFS